MDKLKELTVPILWKRINKGCTLRRHENDYCSFRENDNADSNYKCAFARNLAIHNQMHRAHHIENVETDDASNGEDVIDPWVLLIDDDAALGIRADYDELLQEFIAKCQEEREG